MKKVTFTSLCLLLLGLFAWSGLNAQTNVNMPYNNGPVTFTIAPPTTCSFNFFDNGGAAGAYSNSSGVNSVVTFMPSNSATHRVRVTFATFAAEASFDAIYIYNGANVAAPIICGPNDPVSFPACGWWTNPGTHTGTSA